MQLIEDIKYLKKNLSSFSLSNNEDNENIFSENEFKTLNSIMLACILHSLLIASDL
jgi:hypothetical protein